MAGGKGSGVRAQIDPCRALKDAGGSVILP